MPARAVAGATGSTAASSNTSLPRAATVAPAPAARSGTAAAASYPARGYTPPPVGPAPAPMNAPAPLAAPASGSSPSAIAAGGALMDEGATDCPSCSAPILGGKAFCGRCGYRLRPVSNPGPAPTDQPKAAVVPAAAVPRTVFMTAPVKTVPQGHLTLVRPDGSEGGQHPIASGENLIGRGQGSLFDADPYLSPRHAEFSLSAEGLTVRDLKSLNGVFVKLTEEESLGSGSIFRIGQELLRFDVISPPEPLEDGTDIIGTPNPGYWGRISVIVGRDVDGPAFPIFEEAIVLGRERGDILFPEDGYVSATHARISVREGMVYLQDLGSSNGTFVRLEASRQIPSGSLLLMGQQLFRVSFKG